jgi:hypothetical protein
MTPVFGGIGRYKKRRGKSRPVNITVEVPTRIEVMQAFTTFAEKYPERIFFTGRSPNRHLWHNLSILALDKK